MAHVLRQLKWNVEAYECEWSEKMSEAMHLAWQLKKSMDKDAHEKQQPWVIDAGMHASQASNRKAAWSMDEFS